jgi:hypothetical protein
MPMLLLLLFGVTLSIGLGIIVVVIHRARQPLAAERARQSSPVPNCPYEPGCIYQRPGCWLAIKSRSLPTVQSALGLNNPKPCSWFEAMSGDEKLFIAPPVKGWILVAGSGLPDPSEDVDVCFRFVLALSRKLGQVQLFSASRVLQYHAWVKAERGRIVRAYAWAGKTLWHQGRRTAAENDLDLKCLDYNEAAERVSFSQPDVAAVNVDKVPLLAARWSLDPGHIDGRFLEKQQGVAGEPSRKY